MAVDSALVFVAVLGVGVPLLILEGLAGYAAGLAAGTLVGLVVRFVYLSRLFPAFRLVNHVIGAVVPTLFAAAVILLSRATLPSSHGGGRTAAEVATYVVIVAVTTLATERALLKEAIGYLRRAVRPATVT